MRNIVSLLWLSFDKLRYRYSEFVIHLSSLVVRPSSFVIRLSSFVIRPSSFIIYPRSLVIRPSFFIFCRLSFAKHHSLFILHHSAFIICKYVPAFFLFFLHFSCFHRQSDSFVLFFTRCATRFHFVVSFIRFIVTRPQLFANSWLVAHYSLLIRWHSLVLTMQRLKAT